jgi:hypothetical protein
MNPTPAPSLTKIEDASLRSLGLTHLVLAPEGFVFAIDGARERPCYSEAEARKALQDELEPDGEPPAEFFGPQDPNPVVQIPESPEEAAAIALQAEVERAQEHEAVLQAAEAPMVPNASPAKPSPSPVAGSGGLVVVPDAGDAAGAIVWWRLSGTVNHEILKAAWVAAGLDEDELLSPPSGADALRAAVNGQRARHVLARPLPTGDGWAIVRESADAAANDLAWATGLKVLRDEADALRFEPADHPAAEQIATDYAAALQAHASGTFGAWLAVQARRLGAVGLRESGGVYFLPRDVTAAWAQRTAVLKGISSHVFATVPAMRTEDAVSAVLDALEQEAGGEAAELEAEVMAGGMSPRKLSGRAEKAEAMLAKVERYGRTLGAAMPALVARLEQLKATIAAAALVAQAEKDAAEAAKK